MGFQSLGTQAWVFLIHYGSLVTHTQSERALLALPPEHILSPSLGPHPGSGTAISCLDACPKLPGLLSFILPPLQFVIHLKPEGGFEDVNQSIILCNLQTL